MFDPTDPGPDYELAWPPELFAAEVDAVLRLRADPWANAAESLLTEAFTRRVPTEDLRTVTAIDLPGEVPSLVIALSRFAGDTTAVKRELLRRLGQASDQFPRASSMRPYWPTRTEAPTVDQDDHGARVQHDWTVLVGDLEELGYLASFGQDCVEADARATDRVLAGEIERRLRTPGLWPLEGPWDSGTFYGLIEVVHDLLARPRHRVMHEDCGWHFSDFASAPAQALYRWRVDHLLAQHEIGLRLSSSGEDTGRLVRTLDEARETLIERAQLSPDPDTRAATDHAIALFRGRTATVVQRRSAVVALAGVLESRRTLLKSELVKKDEGALFQIANEFDLRHRDDRQHGDYDPVFLDWVFWWYLATVELTDRLLARQAGETP